MLFRHLLMTIITLMSVHSTASADESAVILDLIERHESKPEWSGCLIVTVGISPSRILVRLPPLFAQQNARIAVREAETI